MVLDLLLFLAANYTTYLGGGGPDVATGMAVDYAGAVYVAGTSSSTNFPVTSTSLGVPSTGHHCGFITKMRPDGNAPEFSVCIPDLIINAFAMDPSGSLYIAVTNLDYSQSVLKLDRNAESIVYSTGFQGNQINAIAVDPYGTVYIAGVSDGTLVTTAGAFQSQLAPGVCLYRVYSSGCADGYVAKLARDGTVAYATYLGGSGPDSATAIAIDAFGNAWVTGTTVSPNFPTTASALQTQFHGEIDFGPLSYGDAFVSELDPTGSTLLYSSYLGGSQADGGNAIAIDGAGAVYVAGFTQSPNFPTSPGTFQTAYIGNTTDVPPGPNGNGFVTKLDRTGALVYSTYLGAMLTAAAGTSITSIAVNAQRQVIAAGDSAYILNAAGSGLVCKAVTYGNLVASDGTDDIFSAGTTRIYQTSIATPGAFQSVYGGGDSDAVIQASDGSRCFQAPTR